MSESTNPKINSKVQSSMLRDWTDISPSRPLPSATEVPDFDIDLRIGNPSALIENPVFKLWKNARAPCYDKLPNITICRMGSFAKGHEWSHRWLDDRISEITTWTSPERKKIQVTQGYGAAILHLEVRKFVPTDGDLVGRKWSDKGVVKSIELPCYALDNITNAFKMYQDFISGQMSQIILASCENSDVRSRNWLSSTYQAAISFQQLSKSEHERDLLDKVLQLAVIVRMTTRPVRIIGTETLGIWPVTDVTSGMLGKRPIPPVLGAQILLILNTLQSPLRLKILEGLKNLIIKRDPANWFCVYLSIFILLHNCSLLTIHDIGYARKHGTEDRNARPELISKLHTGAKVLLANYHFHTEGLHPFQKDADLGLLKVSDEQLDYIVQTSRHIEGNQRLKKLRADEQRDDEFYFVSQMYESCWDKEFPEKGGKT